MGDDQAPLAALPADLVAAVEQFARGPHVLVATDFDGVLAPLVLDPSTSRPLPGTIDSLRTMASLTGVTVAIASGRDLATLRALTGLQDDERIVLIGSHGGESTQPLTDGSSTPSTGLSETEQAALEGATRALEGIVARIPAARIEHKPAGVVLHTRGLEPDAAERAIAAALAVPDDVDGVRAMRGKSVVELSVLDVSKGTALTALAASRGAEVTAYAGDDVTDETAFAVLPTDAGHVTVKVGDGESAAAYRVDNPSQNAAYLALLADRLTRHHK